MADEAKVLRELRRVYEKASEDVLVTIKTLEARTDVENLQSIIYQKSYQEALKKQIDSVLDMLNTKQFTTISDYLTESYEDGFFRTVYDLHNQGIPLIFPMNQDRATAAIQLDTKLSRPLYDSLGVDIEKLKNSIRANLSRGIASNSSWVDVARNIDARMGITMRNSMRIVRTEGHRIQCEAQYDAQVKAKEKGADVVKQWDATLDKRTRPTHQRLDGQIREIDEPFELDGHTAMYPGGFGIAKEDINCRCRCNQRAKWALDEEELKVLEERAKYYGLDKTKDFEDFKRKYINAVDAEKTKPEKFVPAKTIEEAESFISQYVDDSQFGALGTSYSGVSLEVANKINETIYNFYEDFDFAKFGGITAPTANTKLGKQIKDAFAAYSPMRNSFVLNRNRMKSVSVANAHFENEKATLLKIIANPERYDFGKLAPSTRKIIEASITAGRTIVPETIEDAITHELGHMVERRIKKTDSWQVVLNGMDTFSGNISGYATSEAGEYVAESFCSWRKGEKLADPELIKVFRGLMK